MARPGGRDSPGRAARCGQADGQIPIAAGPNLDATRRNAAGGGPNLDATRRNAAGGGQDLGADHLNARRAGQKLGAAGRNLGASRQNEAGASHVQT